MVGLTYYFFLFIFVQLFLHSLCIYFCNQAIQKIKYIKIISRYKQITIKILNNLCILTTQNIINLINNLNNKNHVLLFSLLFSLAGCKLFAKDIGLNRIILVSDSKRIINRLCSPHSDFSYLSALIDDCLNVWCDFEAIRFAHVHRSAHLVAHGHAKLAQKFDFSFSTYWSEEVHSRILPLVVRDFLT